MPPTLRALAPAVPLARVLARLVARRRLPHALLLEGADAPGRLALARALAAALLCPEPVDGDACGRCAHCRHSAAGTHPDLLALPDAEAAPNGLPVETVREAAERAGASALLGVAKVIIVPDAERLRGAAANALLKVLEEPPPRTVFVLAASAAALLLPTIRSRVQAFRLPPAPERPPGGGEAPPPALAALLDAPSLAAIAATLAQLERRAGDGAAQRQLLRQWIDAVIGARRRDLAAPEPARAERALGDLERLLRARADLDLHFPPRTVLEALAFAR